MAAEPWRYEKLTWPEVNQAIEAKKAVVVPVGSIEQHRICRLTWMSFAPVA